MTYKAFFTLAPTTLVSFHTQCINNENCPYYYHPHVIRHYFVPVKCLTSKYLSYTDAIGSNRVIKRNSFRKQVYCII